MGGLGMMDLQIHLCTLKAAWIARILHGKAENWSFIPSQFLNKNNLTDIITTINTLNLSIEEMIRQKLSPFYIQVLQAVTVCNTKLIEPTQKEDILEQSLWGNKWITNNENEILYFYNWIEVGIVNFKDLLIVNKNINENYVYNKITKRVNYLSEMHQLKTATRAWCNIVENNIPFEIEIKPIILNTKKSYGNILRQVFIKPIAEEYWLRYGNNISFDEIYQMKICNIKERKLSEFNYKVLNRILPCRKALHNWDKIENNKCTMCNQIETVEHMLFSCTNIKPIWNIIEIELGKQIDYPLLVLGIDSLDTVWALSVIQYIIFKCWVKTSEWPYYFFKKFIKNRI